MSIEFIDNGNFLVHRSNDLEVTIFKKEIRVIVIGALNVWQLEVVLAKMKELQSPNKDIEFLQADIASLGYLLDMSIERNDPIGKIQLSSRLETRKRELKELQNEVKK